jgi:hypothetical protein
MVHDRRGPDRDRLLVARIAGIARRHAGWGALSEAEFAAAVAELREVAGDRPDLLAEEAGILLGASEGRIDEPRSRAAAQLCIAAGADESLIPGWIEEGRRRAETAKRPPFSGGVRPLRHPAVLRGSRFCLGPVPPSQIGSQWPSKGARGNGDAGIRADNRPLHLGRLHRRRHIPRQVQGP